MARKLVDYSLGRNNNFNLIRLIAASMVLLSHSFTLATGKPELEPFSREIGMTLGSIAVEIFFVMSGFLVMGSLLARKNVLEFFTARALRLYPGLWLSQISTLLVVGLCFTSLTPRAFFTEWPTWHSFLKNCVLLRGVDTTLPGAFYTVPFRPGGVNSSLWTLPIEVGMYIKLGISWLLLTLLPRFGYRMFATFCIGMAVLTTTLDLVNFVRPSWVVFPLIANWSLTAKFFTGATLRLLQDKIVVSPWGAAFLLLALIASMTNPLCYGILYRLVVPYLVIYAALVPSLSRIRFLSRGDYSYGIYIYAYPIQQCIAAVVLSITPAEMFALAYPITFLLAFTSWHLVEERCLRMKEGMCRWISATFNLRASEYTG